MTSNLVRVDKLVDLKEMCLVSGPLELDEPDYSFASSDFECYWPATIADAILSVPGTRQIHPPVPSWNDWKASWNNGQHYIDLDMMGCTEVDPELCNGVSLVWGGSFFRAHCLVSEVLAFWNAIRRRCPGVWLHDAECRFWSPETFAKFYGS